MLHKQKKKKAIRKCEKRRDEKEFSRALFQNLNHMRINFITKIQFIAFHKFKTKEKKKKKKKSTHVTNLVLSCS